MPELTELQKRQRDESKWDFSDLRALTSIARSSALPRSPTHRAWPDMTEHGWERDDWPAIAEQVMAGDTLMLTSPSGGGRSPRSSPR
jgi:hypothetical protein